MVSKEKEGGSLFSVRPKILERYKVEGDQVLKLTGGDAGKLDAAAGKMGISGGKALCLFTFGKLKAADKLFLQDLTEKELGKKLVEIRDVQGLTWTDVWARTLMTQSRAREIYEAAGGKDWDAGKRKRSASPKASSPRAPKGSKPPARKSTAKSPTTRKPTATRAKRTAKKAPTGGGTRAKRAGLLGEVHDLGTTDERLAEILEGRKITVEFSLNGGPPVSREYGVETVKGVQQSPTLGKGVDLIDVQRQSRVVALADIKGIR